VSSFLEYHAKKELKDCCWELPPLLVLPLLPIHRFAMAMPPPPQRRCRPLTCSIRDDAITAELILFLCGETSRSRRRGAFQDNVDLCENSNSDK
jgi:hypothetical protein